MTNINFENFDNKLHDIINTSEWKILCSKFIEKKHKHNKKPN